MKEIIRYIKRLFGKYEISYEYWVRLDEIIVPARYKRSRIGEKKWKHKMGYWLKIGEFESPILLHKNFVLVDGTIVLKSHI